MVKFSSILNLITLETKLFLMFYTVGPFPNVNDLMCELVIQFDDCTEETFGWCDTFNGCERITECSINDIIVEPYCNHDGEIFLDFEFDYTGNHTVFDVVGSGYQFGNFTYGELFYTGLMIVQRKLLAGVILLKVANLLLNAALKIL